MSEKPPHRRLPGNRKFRPLHSLTSSTRKFPTRQVVIRRKPKKPLNKFIRRCYSEPVMDHYIDVVGGTVDDHEEDVFIQPQACGDACWSSPDIVFPYSPQNVEGYKEDSKVVMNVTVEGSPGPVRAMVKLGSSVEETMKIVKRQYMLEGRSPQLDQCSISAFELHSSYFSLQCLDASDKIGDIGSRSFFMRKCSNDDSYMRSGIISTKTNNSAPPNPIILFPHFISHNFKKIGRLSNKLLRIFGCVDE
uniref:uncharacterized protein At4g22758 n=1 Tax=Erigeron canadensis TaxID=72917 RepID=UPI001CB925C4|nr:uncharacterized protein At4g22758 [Erigeron canadensis]